MSEPDLDAAEIGANIVRAVRVMRETQREVSSLLGWLDEALGTRKWAPLHVSSSNWVALTMNGAQIGKPENWMATLVQRGYMPEGSADDPRDRALVVEVDLAPEGATIPVFAALAITLADPMAPRQFWSSWTWPGSGTWRLGSTEGLIELAPSALVRVVNAVPAQARGLIVPLCELDRRSVEARILDPALDLFER